MSGQWSPLPPSAINAAEHRMLDAAADGSWPDFSTSTDDQKTIRAAFLRNLYLQLCRSDTPWGLRVQGARIEGPLDLKDCTGVEGTPLPPLEIMNCDIHDDIDLSYARLARLSIVNCRITHIQAVWVRIDGPFDFSKTRSVNPLSDAWIEARGAQIHGDVDGRGAHLRSPKPRSDVLPGTQRYALGFRNCNIAGRVLLTNGFRALGGVNFSDGDITGEVWLMGAEITCGEGDALAAQSTRFGSVLGLNEGFVSRGQISLLGARIAGSLHCPGAKLDNRKRDGSEWALVATSIEIGQNVSLSGARVTGGMDFSTARVAGQFDCTAATLDNWTEDGSGIALSLVSASIGGSVYLGRTYVESGKFKVSGSVVLSNSKIAGNLECRDAIFNNRTIDGLGNALNARHCRIGGSVLMIGKLFEASGVVGFDHAKIEGDFNCSYATFENRANANSWNQRPALSLDTLNAEIGGELLLDGTVSVGNVQLWGASVGRDVRASHARIVGSMSAPHLRVAGDFLLTDTEVLGNILLDFVEVNGALSWDLRVLREYQHNRDSSQSMGFALSLRNARVGAALNARRLSSDVKPISADLKATIALIVKEFRSHGFPAKDAGALIKSLISDPILASKSKLVGDLILSSLFSITIDLRGAHASALDDEWPTGWGGHEAIKQKLVKLKLDGFVYDRIVDLPAEKSSFLSWLRLLKKGTAGKIADSAFKLSRRLQAAAQHGAPLAMPLRVVYRWLVRIAAAGKKIDRDQKLRLYVRRLEWLRLRPADEFRPQPYRHLARVLRAHGNPGDAREISIAEAWEAPTEWWNRVPKFLFGTGFCFGLSPFRAGLTFALFVAIGWAGVMLALRHDGYMVVTAPPVATVLVNDGDARVPQAAIQNGDIARATVEMPCTSQIVPFFYALDLMLPVIPLHQETACDISTVKPKAKWWREGKLFYSGLGKLVTALALITFSGVLRIRAEE